MHPLSLSVSRAPSAPISGTKFPDGLGMPPSSASQKTDTQQSDEPVRSVMARNAEITRWYHQVDSRISAIIGEPDLPSWARFAKHASYSAGVQLRNIEEVIQAVDAVMKFGDRVWKEESTTLLDTVRIGKKAVLEVSDLFRHRDLLDTVLLVAAVKAGADANEIDRLLDSDARAGRDDISLLRMLPLVVPKLPSLLEHLPSMRQELLRIHGEIAAANEAIYQFMAPRLDSFLANHSGPYPTPSASASHPSARFLDRALAQYAEAGRLAHAVTTLGDGDEERQMVLERRSKLVEQANVLATFGEQLYRVEPHLAKISDILGPLTAFMQFRTPGADQRLAAESSDLNWANIYERMGIDRALAPSDPYSVSPDGFPALLHEQDPRFRGTIGEVLIRGTRDSAFAQLLKQEPETIVAAKLHG